MAYDTIMAVFSERLEDAEAIRQSKGRLTYRELHERASGVLKKRKFDQVPQLEGRAPNFDRTLFSV